MADQVNSVDYELQVARKYGAPLDKYEVFGTYEEAVAYAQSGIAYAGQLIAVVNDEAVNIYKIMGDKLLVAMDANSITMSNELPKPNGVASAGTSGDPARSDHVHPHDDSKLDKTMSDELPKADGQASAGASEKPARGDHVHPHDDSKLNKTDAVTGIKGNAETNYRKGNVNITAANVGALPITGGTVNDVITISKGDGLVEFALEHTDTGLKVAFRNSGTKRMGIYSYAYGWLFSYLNNKYYFGENEAIYIYSQLLTADNGYLLFSNKLCIQWGRITLKGSIAVTLPYYTENTTIFSVQVNCKETAKTTNGWGYCNSFSNKGFKAVVDAANGSDWIAVTYG